MKTVLLIILLAAVGCQKEHPEQIYQQFVVEQHFIPRSTVQGKIQGPNSTVALANMGGNYVVSFVVQPVMVHIRNSYTIDFRFYVPARSLDTAESVDYFVRVFTNKDGIPKIFTFPSVKVSDNLFEAKGDFTP